MVVLTRSKLRTSHASHPWWVIALWVVAFLLVVLWPR